ncbi:RES family NAD+ phosphorylase [Nakamurella sp. GG22]
MIPKLPDRPDPSTLANSRPEFHTVPTSTVLWRIHRTTGAQVTAWNVLREFGPIGSCRFDPHPEGPPRLHPGTGVLYAAGNLPTALAEVFQSTRVVDCLTDSPAATAFRFNRPVRLLDLTGGWPLRAGASHVINTGRRSATRAWARAFLSAWPALDGLWHTSSLTGDPCVTVYPAAADALPDDPAHTFGLSDTLYGHWLLGAADSIGYDLVTR